MNNRFVFLSFDVEEFDLPLEYGHSISNDEQMQLGYAGLESISPLLNESYIETTLFTTANFAQYYPEKIKLLSQKHEIASHSFYHSCFEVNDLITSKTTLELIVEKPILGLRMPRLRKVDVKDIINAGYKYDSSINPTLIPGRYNNLNVSKTIYTENNLVRVPTTVSPTLRIPLFWLSFKNFSYKFYKNLALATLKKYGYLNLYFHPWEFTDIAHYNCLPNYVKKPCNTELLDKLNKLVNDLKSEAEFVSIENYLKNKSLI